MSKYEHVFAICAYGESPYLEICISSLKNQTVKSPIIMTAAQSSTYLEEIAKKYELPFFVRGDKPDICDDWNYAFSCADAKYVTLAHQDDYYDPMYVEIVVSSMGKYKNPILCTTDYLPIKMDSIGKRDINSKIRRLLRWPLKIRFLSGFAFVKKAILSFGNSICCPTVTYNKELLGDNVFVSPLKYSLDWDTFFMMACKEGQFAYVDKPLAYYRIHDGATSKEFIVNHKRIADDEYMFRKFWPNWIVKIIMHFYKIAYQTYDH